MRKRFIELYENTRALIEITSIKEDSLSLTVSDLHKSYQHGESRVEILKGLSLNVKKGEVAAIVGPSGSGKSTLLSLICGLDRPDKGQIAIDGKKIFDLTPQELTLFRGRKMGIVFQQFHLMDHLTAAENIGLPLEILDEPNVTERVQRALKAVGLESRAKHFPSQMSGGENQRVAIARALVVEPALLLADEPTGNLDLATGEKVVSLFFELVRSLKITTCIVTHSPDLAQRCDSIWALENGSMRQAK